MSHKIPSKILIHSTIIRSTFQCGRQNQHQESPVGQNSHKSPVQLAYADKMVAFKRNEYEESELVLKELKKDHILLTLILNNALSSYEKNMLKPQLNFIHNSIPRSSLRYDTNNKYPEFPPIMSDGRSVNDVWDLYKKSMDSFWKVEDIDLSRDYSDWSKMTPDEQHFIKMVPVTLVAIDVHVGYT